MYNELRLAEAPYLSSLSLHWEAVVLMNLRIFVMERGTRRRQETKRQGMTIRERKVKTIESRDNIVFLFVTNGLYLRISYFSIYTYFKGSGFNDAHDQRNSLSLSLALCLSFMPRRDRSFFSFFYGKTDHLN